MEFDKSGIKYLPTMIANDNLLLQCTVMSMLKTIAKVQLHILDYFLSKLFPSNILINCDISKNFTLETNERTLKTF